MIRDFWRARITLCVPTKRGEPGVADDVGADDEQAAGQAAQRFDHPHEPSLGALIPRVDVERVVVGRPRHARAGGLPDAGMGFRPQVCVRQR